MRKEQVLQSPNESEVREGARRVDDALAAAVVVVAGKKQMATISMRLEATVWRGGLVHGGTLHHAFGFHVRGVRCPRGED